MPGGTPSKRQSTYWESEGEAQQAEGQPEKAAEPTEGQQGQQGEGIQAQELSVLSSAGPQDPWTISKLPTSILPGLAASLTSLFRADLLHVSVCGGLFSIQKQELLFTFLLSFR